MHPVFKPQRHWQFRTDLPPRKLRMTLATCWNRCLLSRHQVVSDSWPCMFGCGLQLNVFLTTVRDSWLDAVHSHTNASHHLLSITLDNLSVTASVHKVWLLHCARRVSIRFSHFIPMHLCTCSREPSRTAVSNRPKISVNRYVQYAWICILLSQIMGVNVSGVKCWVRDTEKWDRCFVPPAAVNNSAHLQA